MCNNNILGARCAGRSKYRTLDNDEMIEKKSKGIGKVGFAMSNVKGREMSQ